MKGDIGHTNWHSSHPVHPSCSSSLRGLGRILLENWILGSALSCRCHDICENFLVFFRSVGTCTLVDMRLLGNSLALAVADQLSFCLLPPSPGGVMCLFVVLLVAWIIIGCCFMLKREPPLQDEEILYISPENRKYDDWIHEGGKPSDAWMQTFMSPMRAGWHLHIQKAQNSSLKKNVLWFSSSRSFAGSVVHV